MERAVEGVEAGLGSPMPYFTEIQEAFGHHDVSQIEAHVGGQAAEAAAAIGAEAYATGNKVAFARQPDLHTAAHEAAHVVQQRGGVQLKDGIGRAGDAYEQHADAVADRVVAGESAEGLLDEMARPTSGTAQPGGVQRQEASKSATSAIGSTGSTGAAAFGANTSQGNPVALAQPFEAHLSSILEQSVSAGNERAGAAGVREGGKEDTWRAVLGEISAPVGKIGRVEAPKGLRLHETPSHGSPTISILPFDTLVHVERKTRHGWYYVVSMGDSREGSVTGTGCVEGQYVELDPPEPTAHLHYVTSGEMLKDIAARHYQPKRGFDWGADARLYVEAIWEANKTTGKLLRVGGELPWSEKAVRSGQQEKTLAIWRSVQPKENHAIWIPSPTFVAALEKQAAITSGSISHATWEAARAEAEAFVDFVKYGAGFAVGVLEGAYAAARDLVMGAVDLLGIVYDLLKSLIAEGLFGTAQSIGHKLVDLFKNAPALLKQAGSWFAGQWTQEDDFARGGFHGEVVGYILLQVLTAFLTAGGSAAIQVTGRFASFIKVIRGLDAAGDFLTYARGAARAAKLPAKALAKLRRVGGRAADSIDAASDTAADAGRRAKHVGSATSDHPRERKPRADEGRSALDDRQPGAIQDGSAPQVGRDPDPTEQRKVSVGAKEGDAPTGQAHFARSHAEVHENPAKARTEPSGRDEAKAKLRALRTVDDRTKVEESLRSDEAFVRRKEENEGLISDDERLKKDLATAGTSMDRFNLMRHGDPARGGERLPLAFRGWEQFDLFKQQFAKLMGGLRVNGKPVTAEAKNIGTATGFYSGNPRKPLGHHFDRLAPESMGDVDIELNSPELVEHMLTKKSALNEKVMIGGERVIFKNELKVGSGFHDEFPEIAAFCSHWSAVLGREVDIKLKADMTPVSSLAKPSSGPIEIYRSEASK